MRFSPNEMGNPFDETPFKYTFKYIEKWWEWKSESRRNKNRTRE